MGGDLGPTIRLDAGFPGLAQHLSQDLWVQSHTGGLVPPGGQLAAAVVIGGLGRPADKRGHLGGLGRGGTVVGHGCCHLGSPEREGRQVGSIEGGRLGHALAHRGPLDAKG